MRFIGPGLVLIAALIWLAQLFLPDEGMGFVTGLVVYLISWWTILFMILPRNITGQIESGEVVPGSEPGAPTDPQLKAKLWLTTQATAGFWIVVFIAIEFGLLPGLDFFQTAG